MTALVWGEDNKYVYGVDRGVLHSQTSDLICAWNGLTKVVVEESDVPQMMSAFDGTIYANLVFRGFLDMQVEGFSLPYEMMGMNGEVEAIPGFILTGQGKERFDFCYRRFVNDIDYQLHLIWDVTFTLRSKKRETVGRRVKALEYKWSASAVPDISVPYWHPASSLILDSASTDPAVMTEIEDVLYGTDFTDPSFPSQLDILLAYV